MSFIRIIQHGLKENGIALPPHSLYMPLVSMLFGSLHYSGVFTQQHRGFFPVPFMVEFARKLGFCP